MSARDVPFAKGHGTENDFVVLFDPERALDLTAPLVAAICDRRVGIGADGVLRVVLAATDPEGAQLSDASRWFMDYRNADGSIAEMCGNGVRVFARYLVDKYLQPAGEFAVATRAGPIRVRLGAIGDVTADMGTYELPSLPVTVRLNGRAWPATHVRMPNPHAVVFVDDLDQVGGLAEPPLVEPVEAFDRGVNVEFAVRRDNHHLSMRVYERGVGETRSCGTGACAVAVAVAAAQRGHATDHYLVDAPGGCLRVSLGDDHSVALTGPAELVADGVLRAEWLVTHR